MGTSTPEVVTERPHNVELPVFKAQQQLFAQRSTPMVESGRLWIPLDRTNRRGRWGRLFIDSNGNGRLNDEYPVTAYRTEQYYMYFSPVKVVFQVKDGPVTYHLNLRFYDHNKQNGRLYVHSGGWYEGTITVGGTKRHCVLIDQNANGTFDDKSLEAHKCDRVRIGKKDGQDTRFVGNYIELDGVLYRREAARDGACIKLTKATNVQSGSIRLPESITQFSAGGENGLFTLKSEKGVASLPVGKYRVNHWEIDRKDEKGRTWLLRGYWSAEMGDFHITEGEET
jgi:hypothetical protein